MEVREIVQMLPGVFQRAWRPETPLDALVHAIATLLDPAERQINTFDSVLNARQTPDRFLPMLARWVDLDRLLEPSRRTGPGDPDLSLPTGVGCLRELIANAAYLSQWRGTKKGLLLFLEMATGADGFEVEEEVLGRDNRPLPYHVAVSAPADLKPRERLIRNIIESEKPAYVTYDLLFR